jgi:DNA-binding IclR family transcriptional regulator
VIKVLHKAFEIITCISEHGDAMLPTAIASAVGINQATCVRILRDLVDMGYIEQLGPRQGYMLSLQGWATFSRNPMIERLLAEGSPLVSQYAEKTSQCMFLCVIRNGRRYTVFFRNGHPKFNLVPQRVVYDDCHITATGQLLLAIGPESERQAYLDQCPETVDRKALAKVFTQVQKQGYALIYRKEEFHAIAAYPVYMFGKPVAAVSICMVGDDIKKTEEQRLIKACESCARDLSARLGVHLP